MTRESDCSSKIPGRPTSRCLSLLCGVTRDRHALCTDVVCALQTLLNPFHELNAPIRNQTFDARIKASAKKHF